MEEPICRNCLYWGEDGEGTEAPCFRKPDQIEIGVILTKTKKATDTCDGFKSIENTEPGA